jgi:purine nucleoside phosphorylase
VVEPFRPGGASEVGELALLVSGGGDLKRLGETLPLVSPGERIMMSHIRPEAADSPRFCAAGPMVGAPYAAMLLETLVARGVRRAVFIGWCGALSPNLSIGDLLVPEAALVDEGTSVGYGRLRDEPVAPDPALSESLREAIARRGRPPRRGAVWTTDAIYRETPSKIRKFRDRGAVAVEMETSALFTVGRFRNISVAALLVVSDSLADFTWRPGFRDPRFQSGRRLAREVLSEQCPKPSPPPK